MRVGANGLRIAQAAAAAIALGLLIRASLPPQSYKKDLQQEYLTACALREGIDLSTPVTELSARYFPEPTDNFPHASPYPAFVAVLSVPLTVLPFPVVAFLWLVFNVGILLIVGRWLGLSPYASLALVAWPPLWFLLLIGQLEIFLLALIMLGWRAAAAGRDWRAGMWLGVAGAIKLYPLLLLVPFIARRRRRVVLAAGLILTLSQVINVLTVGMSGVLHYYLDTLPAVSYRYTYLGLNSAPHGALLRILGGAKDVLPIVDIPSLVLPLTAAVLLFALACLWRLRPEAAPPAVLAALPSGWYYQIVLALPQIIALLRHPKLWRAALPAVVAASFVLPLVNLLLEPILRIIEWHGDKAPPIAAALTAVQPAGLLAVLVLSVIMERRRAKATGSCSR